MKPTKTTKRNNSTKKLTRRLSFVDNLTESHQESKSQKSKIKNKSKLKDLDINDLEIQNLNISHEGDKKYNIVFDIDGTLVKTGILLNELTMNAFLEDRLFYVWLYESPEGLEERTLKKVYALKRPYINELFELTRNHFNIYFWSAGKKNYVEQVLNNIINFEPKGVFTREDMFKANIVPPLKPISYLQKVTNNAINPSNTIHVDDLEITFSLNKENGLLIPEFYGKDEDICLYILKTFFDKIKYLNIDARKIDKKIFVDECLRCNLSQKFL